jgi:anti-sigma B factor antagonist
MTFREETIGNVHVIHLKGKIMDIAEMQTLSSRLKELTDAGTRSIVMDFGQVRWVNSYGIGAIIASLTTVRRAGGDLRFANVQGATRQYFQITKLETVVKLYESVEEAVASFNEK